MKVFHRGIKNIQNSRRLHKTAPFVFSRAKSEIRLKAPRKVELVGKTETVRNFRYGFVSFCDFTLRFFHQCGVDITADTHFCLLPEFF